MTLLVIAASLLGCTSAAEWRARAEHDLGVGDRDAAEATVQKGLEAHPEDVELLLFAGEMYLSPEPTEGYKPRLALHYALRADRAAVHQDKRATRLLTRAYRATGGSAFGDELVQAGLEQLGHRDALAPKRLGATDPDLLEPTSANLREQARRDAARKADQSPCPITLVHVPEGTYPGPGGSELRVASFCIRPGGRSARGCSEGRECSPDERVLACTALGAVLGADPGCADPSLPRCCADPQNHAAAGSP